MQRAGSRHRGRKLHGRDLARGLGWISLALGAAEMLAPRRLSDVVGMASQPALLRACRLREVVSGAGILASADPRPWSWSRIAGDVADLAGLAPGLSRDSPRRTAARLQRPQRLSRPPDAMRGKARHLVAPG